TMAEMISARTDRIRPMVMTAPTMVRSWAMPGSPSSLGVMSTSIGISAGRAVMRSNTVSLLVDEPAERRGTRMRFSTQVHARPHASRRESSEAEVDLELLAQVDEPVQPGHPTTGQDCGTEGDEDTGAGLPSRAVVAIGGGDGPDVGADDQHQYRGDKHERQQRTDHRAQATNSTEPVEVWEDVHAA